MTQEGSNSDMIQESGCPSSIGMAAVPDPLSHTAFEAISAPEDLAPGGASSSFS